MRLSRTRLSEIENLPDDTIDTSDIPELGNDFWETLDGLFLKITFRLNKKSWNGSRDRGKITTRR